MIPLFMSPLATALLKNAALRRALIGGGLGFVGSTLENQTLLSDANPSLKHTNQFLGTLAGAGASKTRGAQEIAEYLGKTWIPKQFVTFGLNEGDKYIREQVPIANTQLETATKALETAKIQADAAKHFGASDMARLGLAGAGLAGAGGLGYYLYNTLGPGKKKPSPKVTVTMHGRRGDETQVEGDMDTLDLSKRLHKQLQRDARRKLREETKQHTQHNGHHPSEGHEPPHGIVRQVPEEDQPSTMSNIMNLLRN